MGKRRRAGSVLLMLAMLCTIIVLARENGNLKEAAAEAGKENARLSEQIRRTEEEAAALSDTARTLQCVEEGIQERIRRRFSAYDMEVAGVYPVGDDTDGSVKRFYVCIGRYSYWTEFYLADYVTGEICNLSDRVPQVGITYSTRDEDGGKVEKTVDWEFLSEDFDGDGTADILLVVSFADFWGGWKNPQSIGGIFLWLQRDGEFVCVNSGYCGKDTSWQDNDFSLRIDAQEDVFRERQKPEEWTAEKVGAWVREELFDGRTEELEALLKNPEADIPYMQRREAENVHVTVEQDERERLRVSIPENPYSEGRINDWLLAYYEEMEKRGEESGTEKDAGGVSYIYDYGSGLECKRADDAVVCFRGSEYEYAGGAHGNIDVFSVNFDARSGRILTLADIFPKTERFCKFAVSYIEENYEEHPWGWEEVRDAVMEENWFLDDCGITFFSTSGNGTQYYEYMIPYEEFADAMKTEYLPAAEPGEK